MALVLLDRVQQTGTANTTVSFTLSGSVTGYQSFTAIGNGNTTYYAATDTSGNWEAGIGTYSTTGPTLTRTTILSSSNSGSAVTFSGTVNVFVTYPASKSVNLDASSNVSALGTVASGTWQGTTVGVAYGGTGVTTSSGANSVVLRDANQNITINRLSQQTTTVTAAGGTTTLTVASTFSWVLNGTGGQTFKLPDATTLTDTTAFEFNNNATGTLTITNNAGATVGSVASGGAAAIALIDNSTIAGTWDVHAYIPESVTWGTNALALGSTVISGGTWQGGTIQPAYGGTGLTTFSAANNALYSTGATTLTAGTLPVAAGGTGATTLTGYVYGNGTSAMTASTTIPTSSLSGSINLATQVTGTLPLTNGGTGQTTAAAAFNALNPMTTTGDIIYEASASTAARLGIGTTGQVLTVAGGLPSWATPSTGGGTITRTDFTATAGQTVFTVSYTVGLIDVYQNGAKLAQADFTATNGTSFTLATGAAAGDLIQAEVFSSLNIYSTITYEVFNGTGSQTVFTMSSVPANSASTLVAISGVVQDPGTYSVSSTTLTFTTAPPSGTGNISVRYLGVASVGTVGSFSAGTTGLTPSSATTGAVVLAGTLNVANGGTGLNSFTANQIHYGTFSQSSGLTFNGTTFATTNDASISGLTVGKGAGSVVSNTAVGSTALTGNTTGSSNTSVGRENMYSNTTGSLNTAVGNSAMFYNTTGAGNVAVGSNALQANTTAAYNSAVGYQAGYTNSTGRIDAFGAYVLQANTTGVSNVGMGGSQIDSISSALRSNTTGSYNTGIGMGALGSNTTASDNTAIGYQAGYSSTTNGRNTAIGYRAAYANTSEGITAIGRSALQNNTTGSDNLAIGYLALLTNTTANYNVGIGTGALQSSNSDANTAIGWLSQNTTSSGAYNTSIGMQSMWKNTTGQYNNASGYLALQQNTTGSFNTAYGALALTANTTASYNTAVGYQAGYTNTTSEYSTYLGYQAGNNATGQRNTFVGAQAGTSITSGASNTIIGRFGGNSGGLDIRTASNYIVLSDGDGNPRLVVDGSGNFQKTGSGSATLYPAYSCRAWVNFNGTGTVAIRGSGNVSSITDNGTGQYTVNLTTSMPDANYSAVASVGPSPGKFVVIGDTTFTSSAYRVQVSNAADTANVDPTYLFTAIFR
jgi:hypothetical protein